MEEMNLVNLTSPDELSPAAEPASMDRRLLYRNSEPTSCSNPFDLAMLQVTSF